MKFELADSDVKVIEGKFAQLPFDRFTDLIEYVEDLEARLLAAEINLREADRVGREMDETVISENPPALSQEDVKRVNSVLARLEPPQLKKAVEKQGISVRKLAIMTGIPYATLYRYLHAPSCPIKAATNIWRTLNGIRLKTTKQPTGGLTTGAQPREALKSR